MTGHRMASLLSGQNELENETECLRTKQVQLSLQLNPIL